jgi:hypothetical protein
MAIERNRGWIEEEETHLSPRCRPGRHGGAVPARPTRRGRGKTSPRRHREHHNRRFHRRAHTHRGLLGDAQLAEWKDPVGWEIGVGRGRFSEWDPTMDLLREEAADETVRWRWKRALGWVIPPRWRRRWSPGLAGAARRRRRRSSRQRERGEEEVRECGAGLGRWFDPDPSRAAKPNPSGLVGPVGQIGRKGFGQLI